jgi:tetratricopeptide (TPR) repeat protein
MLMQAKEIALRISVLFAVAVGVQSMIAFADDPPSAETATAGQEEAAPVGDEEISAAREQAIPVFNEGVTALEAEDMTTALAKFREASEIDPDFVDASRATAAVAMELQDFQTAADAAENLVRLDPQNVDAIGTAYFAELMIGDIDRLIPSARRLADASPAVVSNEMLQHARVLFDDNEFRGSRSLSEVILEREPELAPAYFQLGLTCNMQGDAECARKALEKFIELEPEGADAETAKSLLDYLD